MRAGRIWTWATPPDSKSWWRTVYSSDQSELTLVGDRSISPEQKSAAYRRLTIHQMEIRFLNSTVHTIVGTNRISCSFVCDQEIRTCKHAPHRKNGLARGAAGARSRSTGPILRMFMLALASGWRVAFSG